MRPESFMPPEPRFPAAEPRLLWTGLLCLGLAIGAIGCAGGGEAEAEPGPRVEALEVHRGPFRRRLLLTGELVAEKAVELTTPNVGIWPVTLRRLVEDGTQVRAGEPVVEFDNSQIVSNLENFESQLVEALNQLDSRHSELAHDIEEAAFAVEQKNVELQKAEIRADIPPQLSSRQDFERRRLDLERARLEVQAAEKHLASTREAAKRELAVQELAVSQARQQVERARQSIEALTVSAPQDGIALVSIHSDEGRPFQAGDTSFPGWIVASLPDLSTLGIEASLFDVDDGKVKPGDRVTATLDSFPDWVMEGTVREVDSIAEQTDSRSTRRVFQVHIDLDELDLERMRPGMSVKVETAPTDDEEHLLIPRPALVVRDHESLVALADGSLTPVVLGSCNPEVCVAIDGPPEGTALGRAPVELGSTTSDSPDEGAAP